MTVFQGDIVDIVHYDTGTPIVVQEQESVDIFGRLTDSHGNLLSKSAVATFTLTLFNESDGSIINGKNGTDITSYLKDSGEFEVHLDGNDNSIMDASLGFLELEKHIVLLTWTWTESSVTRTARSPLRIRVQNLGTVV